MCGFYHKLGHLKEHYHYNLENPNNKLKDQKKVNKVFLQVGKGTSGNRKKKGN